MLSIAQALSTAQRLRAISDSWQLDTQLLLSHALQKPREYLYTWPEQQLLQSQSDVFNSSMARRESGEPIAYILGHRAFWDFELAVNEAVLIPRPETELLVETALQILQAKQLEVERGNNSETKTLKIADLGTGSGAIAIALARSLPDSEILASDISEQALAVARSNADFLGVKNIRFRQASWCECFDNDGSLDLDKGYDLILSNPPYIDPSDEHLNRGDIRFEPRGALVASQAGLADIVNIARHSHTYLNNESWLLLEHGCSQRQSVAQILTENLFKNISCLTDLSGLDRVTIAQRLD